MDEWLTDKAAKSDSRKSNRGRHRSRSRSRSRKEEVGAKVEVDSGVGLNGRRRRGRNWNWSPISRHAHTCSGRTLLLYLLAGPEYRQRLGL